MNERLQILKDSIDHVFASDTYIEYQSLKNQVEKDSQYQMYLYIINNKDKFSTKVYNSAKFKFVNKQSDLNMYRKQLDEAFNQLLKMY